MSVEEIVVLGVVPPLGVDFVLAVVTGHHRRTHELVRTADAETTVVVDLFHIFAHDRQRHHAALAAADEVHRLVLAADPGAGHQLRGHAHEPRVAVLVRSSGLTADLHVGQPELPPQTARRPRVDHVLKHREHRVGRAFADGVLRLGNETGDQVALTVLDARHEDRIGVHALIGKGRKVISTAQIGYDEEGFENDQAGCNLKAIKKHIRKAKELACGNGLVGVNIMVALKHYKEHVQAAVAAGADVIISGAGLPMNLPELVSRTCRTKIAPIVSSKRATQLILKMWAHRYDRTADFIVVEGPKAGGHLGFSNEQLAHMDAINFDGEIRQIIDCKKEYEQRYQKNIPVIVAGGIFDQKDISHALDLGADGVQIASRFVATEECDASEAYKEAYIHASEENIEIIQSPVGMPGRALRNKFIDRVKRAKLPISKCYNCLEKCSPQKVPYCITKALIDAVRGDVENGLVFCGANTGRIHEITTVHHLMQELAGDLQ